MENIPSLEELKNSPIEVEVVGSATEVVPTLAEEKAKYLVEAQRAKEMEQEAIELARKQAIERIAAWASKRKIFNGTVPPDEKQLNRIFRKLKKGLPIVKAIKGVCSVPTWNKWKEEFPEVAAMEEQANAVAIDRLLDRKEALSNRPGTKMGEIARDKVQMDELQNRIDRLDRLTENRNSKKGSFGAGLVPIQINVGYGK